jgi:hypothetical protein
MHDLCSEQLLVISVVDAQSFASCSAKFPSLCAEGAYPNPYSGVVVGSPSRNVTKATYTPAELMDVVDFAKGYGVRIQPEWDMPGRKNTSCSLLQPCMIYALTNCF